MSHVSSQPFINSIKLYRKAGLPIDGREISLSESSKAQLGTKVIPVIMLHGWQNDLRSLQLLGDLISASLPVCLIDLPGFGNSPMHDGTWGTADYGDCVHNYMVAEGIAKAIIMGHSFGSRVAIRIAYKYLAAGFFITTIANVSIIYLTNSLLQQYKSI